MKGITNSCALMCLCYLCNGLIRLLEYIEATAIRENITVKNVNKTSLIRSSPNAPGLRLLLQPFSVASLLCSQVEFYNSELDSRLTKHNEVSRNGVRKLSLLKLDL